MTEQPRTASRATGRFLPIRTSHRVSLLRWRHAAGGWVEQGPWPEALLGIMQRTRRLATRIAIG